MYVEFVCVLAKSETFKALIEICISASIQLGPHPWALISAKQQGQSSHHTWMNEIFIVSHYVRPQENSK